MILTTLRLLMFLCHETDNISTSYLLYDTCSHHQKVLSPLRSAIPSISTHSIVSETYKALFPDYSMIHLKIHTFHHNHHHLTGSGNRNFGGDCTCSVYMSPSHQPSSSVCPDFSGLRQRMCQLSSLVYEYSHILCLCPLPLEIDILALSVIHLILDGVWRHPQS